MKHKHKSSYEKLGITKEQYKQTIDRLSHGPTTTVDNAERLQKAINERWSMANKRRGAISLDAPDAAAAYEFLKGEPITEVKLTASQINEVADKAVRDYFNQDLKVDSRGNEELIYRKNILSDKQTHNMQMALRKAGFNLSYYDVKYNLNEIEEETFKGTNTFSALMNEMATSSGLTVAELFFGSP